MSSDPAARASTKLPLTVLLAVKNEAANLPKCLEALRPVERVLVVDSGSTDETVSIAQNAGAEVVTFYYQGGYPKKRQWALNTQNIRTPWVLLLDADEVVPDALWEEIVPIVLDPANAPSQPLQSSAPDTTTTTTFTGDLPEKCRTSTKTQTQQPVAYFITKGFHFLGRRFRFGGFSFGALLLIRPDRCRFEQLLDDEPASAPDMEIHERIVVDGQTGRLRTPLIHDDWKGLEAYLRRHNAYSTWEARVRAHYFKTGRWGNSVESSIRSRLFGNAQERRRFLKALLIQLPIEPWLWFAYHYFWKGGFLEGRRGWIAARIRSQYVADARAKLFEGRLQNRPRNTGSS